MRKLSDLAGRELRWAKADAGYSLRDGEDTVATLRFRSAWGSFATAESADGCWTFKRAGFLRTRATIRPCDSDDEIASFTNNTWSHGGTLELPDGQRLQADSNLWMTTFSFSTETGEPLLRFTNIGGVFSWSSRVEILPSGAAFRGAPWLAMLGWYLSIQMRKDACAG
jgi:hypothetical protein